MSLMPEMCMHCGQYHGCPPWPREPLFKPLPAVESMEEVAQLRRERDALLAAAKRWLVYCDGCDPRDRDGSIAALRAAVAACASEVTP